MFWLNRKQNVTIFHRTQFKSNEKETKNAIYNNKTIQMIIRCLLFDLFPSNTIRFCIISPFRRLKTVAFVVWNLFCRMIHSKLFETIRHAQQLQPNKNTLAKHQLSGNALVSFRLKFDGVKKSVSCHRLPPYTDIISTKMCFKVETAKNQVNMEVRTHDNLITSVSV